MGRLVAYSAGLLLTILGLLIWRNPSSVGFIFVSGLAIGFVIPLIDAALTASTQLRIIWYALTNWNKIIRVSASYLYRIEVEGKYLLVFGGRFKHYQPVGGVYKRHASSRAEMAEMKVLNDELIAIDAVSESDLRVRLPGKHLVRFVAWFTSRKGREIDGWREFQEELIETDILPADEFRHIKYDFLAQRIHPLRFSEWAQCQELFIADIFDLLPSPEQLRVLKALKDSNDPRILWASEEQIRRRGAVIGSAEHDTKVAETAMWIVDPSLKPAR